MHKKLFFEVEITGDVTGFDKNGFHHHFVNTLSYNNSQKPGKSQIWSITGFACTPLNYISKIHQHICMLSHVKLLPTMNSGMLKSHIFHIYMVFLYCVFVHVTLRRTPMDNVAHSNVGLHHAGDPSSIPSWLARIFGRWLD